jgi:glyoxylase-like metal-dependent hydrolase (beta-lactamase superfamily II)
MKPNDTLRALIFSALLFISLNLTGYQVNAQINVRVDHPTALAVLPNTTVDVNPKKGYLLKEIRDKVYYVTDGLYQMMFIVTDEGVVAVDAPPYIGANILKAIKEVTDKPVTYVIYSHCHPDHIGSATLFPPEAQYVTGEKSAEELARHNTGAGTVPFGIFVGGKPVPAPTRTFKDSLTLVVGGRTIKLLTTGQAAHSSEDVIVFLPKEKIAMVVDIVWPGWVPFEQVAYSEDVDGYLNLQKYLLTLDFDTLVSGHWSKLGTKQDIINNMEYIHDLIFYEAEGFAKADFKQLAAKTGTANINLFMENYFDEVALYATKKVEAKWDGKLSGCDVWTYNHARRLIPFVRESGVTIPLQ